LLKFLAIESTHLIFGTFKSNLWEKRGDVMPGEEKQMHDHFSAEKDFL